MKASAIKCLLLGLLLLIPAAQGQAQLGIAQVIQAGIKRVIKAVDLRIQRLQNKTIWLQTSQRKIENWMSKLQLEDIANWSARQRELYTAYYQELRQVKKVLGYFQGIRQLSELQEQMLREYREAWNQLQDEPLFDVAEKGYMQQVYQGMLKECLQQVDLLALLLESMTTQMTDSERLGMLQQVQRQMERTYADLKAFHSQQIQLRGIRASRHKESRRIKELYGIN